MMGISLAYQYLVQFIQRLNKNLQVKFTFDNCQEFQTTNERLVVAQEENSGDFQNLVGSSPEKHECLCTTFQPI